MFVAIPGSRLLETLEQALGIGGHAEQVRGLLQGSKLLGRNENSVAASGRDLRPTSSHLLPGAGLDRFTARAQDGEVRVGLTYMTGALVKLGKGITTALTGGDRLAWAPYLLLWLGLVLGAAFGALAFTTFGAAALWIAAAAMASLAAAAFGLRIGGAAAA